MIFKVFSSISYTQFRSSFPGLEASFWNYFAIALLESLPSFPLASRNKLKVWVVIIRSFTRNLMFVFCLKLFIEFDHRNLGKCEILTLLNVNVIERGLDKTGGNFRDNYYSKLTSVINGQDQNMCAFPTVYSHTSYTTFSRVRHCEDHCVGLIQNILYYA